MARKDELEWAHPLLGFTEEILRKWLDAVMRNAFRYGYDRFLKKFRWEERVWILWYVWRDYSGKRWRNFLGENLKHYRLYRNLAGYELEKIEDELFRYMMRVVDSIPEGKAERLAKKVDDYFLSVFWREE